MKSTFIKFIAIFAFAIFSVCGIANTTTVFAVNDVCSSSAPSEVKTAAGCDSSSDQLTPAITSILSAVIGLAGLVAVIFIIIGGVNYMTSSGDSGKVEKARKTILYACIGLIVCALAFVIVNFVISTILNQ